MNILFEALNFFINIIFPPCCLICGKMTENVLCNNCEINIFSEIKMKIENERKNKEIFYTRHIFFCMYEKSMRKLILEYK